MTNAKIEDVEGIGPVIGEEFRAIGIKDTDSLLENCRTPHERKDLSAKTGIPESQILKFANMVDLFRVRGIGPEYSQLLEAAGVDTVPELARRNPANLAEALHAVNEEKKLTRRLPTEAEVAKWVEQAKTLPRMLEY